MSSLKLIDEATGQSIETTGCATFLPYMGIEQVNLGLGRASLTWQFDEGCHANGMKVAHGGVVGTLLDVVMGYAASNATGELQPIATVAMTTHFIQPISGKVTAQGSVSRAGSGLVYCVGEVRNAAGEIAAQGLATFKIMRARASAEISGACQ
jgi:uncharacterized protein (TIGR00369 family)